ncbi:ORF54 [Agrotis segetum granulovirus]|uniref:superoxide dismutase n=1 Tax=Agrotis segetum granulosis virus TaxID=10464 RepID=Q6QXJ7_GVAS|nr:hypothetical protein AsGV064 [Agrotis segetum granulovirus]AAS82684.1 ORF54 [Agrotis segetum granulovirus]AHN92103.1 sod [Agrotis segetum granulovirus]AKN63338.1 hypothetical protein AsGV064 [Agrotis segetum granulovirus]
MRGICILKGDVSGTLLFIQDKVQDRVKITGVLHKLPRGNHGIHIHEFGDVSNGCTSAGEHFNPHHKQHGGPKSSERHLGDLGNIYSDGSATTKVSMYDNLISLYGMHSILGRSVVIHAMEDDLGAGENELSKITGNSGSRLCCGIIGVKKQPIVTF